MLGSYFQRKEDQRCPPHHFRNHNELLKQPTFARMIAICTNLGVHHFDIKGCHVC